MVRANELRVNKCAMPMCGRISGVCQLWLVSVGRSVWFFEEYILIIGSSMGGWFCWHLPIMISFKFAKQVAQKSQIVGQMLIIVTVSKSIMFSNVIVAFSRSHIEVPADLSDERGLAVRPLDLFVIVKSSRLKLFCVGRIAWLVAS